MKKKSTRISTDTIFKFLNKQKLLRRFDSYRLKSKMEFKGVLKFRVPIDRNFIKSKFSKFSRIRPPLEKKSVQPKTPTKMPKSGQNSPYSLTNHL